MRLFLLLIVIAALIIVGPFLILWSVETICKIPMEYSFWEWLAAAVFVLILTASRSSSKD